jgi:hypothetical protein
MADEIEFELVLNLIEITYTQMKFNRKFEDKYKYDLWSEEKNLFTIILMWTLDQARTRKETLLLKVLIFGISLQF